MKKPFLTYIFILSIYSNFALAQSEKSYAINAGAGHAEITDIHVTYFIGDYIGYDSSPELLLTTSFGDITIYPNPVKTILNIKTDITDLDKIQIYTINGVVIQESELLNHEVNFSEFPDGLYLMKFLNTNAEVVGSIKVVKN